MMIKAGIWFGFILVLLLGIVSWSWPKSGVYLTVCDVGQADALVIQEQFSQMIVDTGNPDALLDSCLGKVVPFWDTTLEAVIITHADSDHMGGLKQLQRRYRIKQVITTAAAHELVKAIVPRSTVMVVKQGDRWQFGSTSGEVLWPTSTEVAAGKTHTTNEMSLVWRMVYGNSSVWFAGDADCEIEAILLQQQEVEPTQYLKIGHHGSKSSTCEPFLRILQPRQAIISVGLENNYGHPHRDLLMRLEGMGIPVRRTDREGTIRIKL